MSTVPPVLGIAEVVLSVKDISTMEAFYQQALGFETHSHASLENETHDPDGDPTILFMTIREMDTPLGRNGHPQMLVLIDYRRHANARRRIIGHDITRTTLNHLAFEIQPEDYAAHKSHLESQGLAVEEARFKHMSATALFFKDPEGNTLELICNVKA